MEAKEAAGFLGSSFISPEFLIEKMGAQFSQEELRALSEVPITKEDLSAGDPFDAEFRPPVRNKFILFPTPLMASRGPTRPVPLNVNFLIEKFGVPTAELKDSIVFTDRDPANHEGRKWEEWRKAVPPSPEYHPLHRPFSKVQWVLLRKSPPLESFQKPYDFCAELSRKSGYDAPTLLEVLVGLGGYFFSVKQSVEKLQKDDWPKDFDPDTSPRILHSRFSWTSDEWHVGDKLAIGLNDKTHGVYIHSCRADNVSRLTGMLPVKRLN